MNKFLKTIVATMGATNAVFSMFIPIAVCLLLIRVANGEEWQEIVLICAAIISTLYRGIKIGLMK